jgi:hypothetical protein
MQRRTLVFAIATVLALAIAAGHAVAAQDMSKYPDWSGAWMKPAGVGNNWISDRPGGRGQQAPLTPEYQALFDAIAADRTAGA